MAVEILKGSLEERIISAIMENYPITLEELRSLLRISEDILNRKLKALAARGALQMEPLPDKTFLRLVGDIRFIGPKSTKRSKKKGARGDYEGIMFV